MLSSRAYNETTGADRALVQSRKGHRALAQCLVFCLSLASTEKFISGTYTPFPVHYN